MRQLRALIAEPTSTVDLWLAGKISDLEALRRDFNYSPPLDGEVEYTVYDESRIPQEWLTKALAESRG